MSIAQPLHDLLTEATPGPWIEATAGGSGKGSPGVIPEIVKEENEDQTGDWLPIAYFSDAKGDAQAHNWEANRKLIIALCNAGPAIANLMESAYKAADILDEEDVDDGDELREAVYAVVKIITKEL